MSTASKRDLAPQWIIAIATLIAAFGAAGFFAFRDGGNADESASVPTTQAGTNVNAQATPTQPVDKPAAPANGSLLGIYSFTLAMDYAVPLRDQAPVQADFARKGTGGDTDLVYSNFAGVHTFQAVNKGTQQMLGLAGNPAPTYDQCRATTLFVSSIPAEKGRTFCLSTSSRMFGVTVDSINKEGNPWTATLSVVSWSSVPA